MHRHRGLTFWMCLALVMGNMIGSGVFLLPVSLAPLGWNAVIGWGVTIGGTLCLAFVFSQLAHALPGGSGAFTYADAAFGPGIGFIVAWSYWISCWVVNATLAVAAVSNLSILIPRLSATGPAAALLAVGFLWFVTALNCLGVRTAGRTQVITTVLKLLPLLGAVILAGWVLARGTVTPPALSDALPVSLGGVSSAAALTLFALLGFESALAAGDRIETPEKLVPRATLIGTVATGAIYLLSCTAVTMLLPVAVVAGSNAPFATFFATLSTPIAGPIVALFAAIAALGALNGFVLLQGEQLLPLAKRGMVPTWFAVQNRHQTPLRIHLLSSGLATLLVFANYSRGLAGLFTFMVLVTTSVSIIFYIAGVLSALKLGRQGRVGTSTGFAALSVIGLLYALWALYGAGLEASLWSLLMTAAGIPIYLLTARSRAAQQSAEQAPVA